MLIYYYVLYKLAIVMLTLLLSCDMLLNCYIMLQLAISLDIIACKFFFNYCIIILQLKDITSNNTINQQFYAIIINKRNVIHL